VEVLGRLSTGELAERYRRAWVFCLPSTYEGFGVPYIEAMASGTAVVTTPNPGSTEVLEGGRWGTLASDAALGDAIVRVLTDVDERQRLEALGLERASRFGWDTIVAEYEAIYREIINGVTVNAPEVNPV
jgi:glycosyltransferase involved in cell wall biosynthesis